MDKTRAKHLVKEVEGKTCSGWTIKEYINCGKSAIVLKAERGAKSGAIKIFDPELIEKHGAEIQAQRIDREMSLIGKSHLHLVEILDGGFWKGPDLYFVVMEYLPWRNLADILTEIPVGRERAIISQVASAAAFLESLDICHRDIKPENIGISNDFQTAKLLDLGVIRPHGTKPVTDGTHGKIFVGTLKYSPPEFLLRQEKDTLESWRAISFYQLGGVLHDLIMRRPLFSEFENPFAVLVNAVQHEKPEIESKSVSPALVETARYCLIKNPATRLQLVSWKDFEGEPDTRDPIANIRSKIARRILAKTDVCKPPSAKALSGASSERLDEYAKSIASICRLECVENRTLFPPVELQIFQGPQGGKCVAVQFDPSETHGLPTHLRVGIHIRWVDPDNDVVEIVATAFTSLSAFPAEAPNSKKGEVIFRGAYTSDSVRRETLPALYRALDRAQQQKSTKRRSAVSQLNLKETRNE